MTARLALLFLLSAAGVQAQSVERVPVTFTLGLGPSADGGAHFSTAFAVQRGRAVRTLRLSSTEFGAPVSTGFLSSGRRSSTQDLSLMAGLAQPVAAGWQVTGLAGVSVNRTTRRIAGPCSPTVLGCIPSAGSSNRESAFVGLPVEVSLHGPVVGAFGVSVRAFGNVNARQNNGGLALDLRFNPARSSLR